MNGALWNGLPYWARLWSMLLAGLWGCTLALTGVSSQDGWLILWGLVLVSLAVFAVKRTHSMSVDPYEAPTSLAAITAVQTSGLALLLLILLLVGLAALVVGTAIALMAIFFSAADS